MSGPGRTQLVRRGLALAAVLFGIATLVSGTRVLAGSDPGYAVFRPLLIFNTIMGAAYVAAGLVAWGSSERGKYAAGAILCLNALALGTVAFLYATAEVVALESLGAMAFRTLAWLGLLVGFARLRSA